LSLVHPGLEANFLKVLEDHTAGDPMQPGVKWTNLSRRQIARRLKEMGTPASKDSVRGLLYRHGYRRRQASKSKPMGRHPDRDAQFRKIAKLRKAYARAKLPVISIDTKKKELLGDFYREGVIETLEPVRVNDHDFVSQGQGTLIPHGVYDLAENRGYVQFNTSHDTTELACDSIEVWWREHGQKRYAGAKKLLVLCDGGGSNSASKYIFKQDLQALADRLGLEIRVAHYPPYCSKYNPIEHRLFAHLSHACRGVIFRSVETAKHYMEKTQTQAGLSVVVSYLNKTYETGRKYVEGFKKTMKIVLDRLLPKWNYTAVPQVQQVG
jgi:Rhodopirellula transposase DDE domain